MSDRIFCDSLLPQPDKSTSSGRKSFNSMTMEDIQDELTRLRRIEHEYGSIKATLEVNFLSGKRQAHHGIVYDSAKGVHENLFAILHHFVPKEPEPRVPTKDRRFVVGDRVVIQDHDMDYTGLIGKIYCLTGEASYVIALEGGGTVQPLGDDELSLEETRT